MGTGTFSRLFRGSALVLSAGLAFVGVSSAAETDAQPMLGQAAPAFALKGVDGKSLSLEALRGRWLVVHFGASW
jgi:Peroxiredoxin